MRLATTRRSSRAAVATVGALVLALSACGSSNSPGSTKPTSSASAPTATATSLPTVKGGYGVKPTISFPDAKPGSKLEAKVLSEGTGPIVSKGQLVIVDYLGQIWRGKVFDNSFDRKQPFGSPIGVGQIIPGWDKELVGKKVGSRVLLVIPPADGYGKARSKDAGIKGTDTIVFVVDIVAIYSKSDTGDKAAVPQQVSTAPVTVTGALGARPEVTIAKGAKTPTAAKVTVLAKGKGAPAKAGLVVLQYEATYFTGEVLDSTYVRGYPVSEALGVSGEANPFDTLIGVPIGSRVLIVAPVQSAEGKKVGAAIVVDLVAEATSAKAK